MVIYFRKGTLETWLGVRVLGNSGLDVRYGLDMRIPRDTELFGNVSTNPVHMYTYIGPGSWNKGTFVAV